MLALTRDIRQGIIINEEVAIKVISLHDTKITFGIYAPKYISILRDELV